MGRCRLGLGHQILIASSQLLTARMFAAIVVLSAIAIFLFALVTIVERLVVTWDNRGDANMRAHQAGRAGTRPRIYTRSVAIVLAGAALALGIVACGDDEEETGTTAEPQRIDLALDFYVNPDHAALEKGSFEQEGLDVRPRVPSDPSAPIKQVAARRPISRSPTSPRSCWPRIRDWTLSRWPRSWTRPSPR